jgi:hypothetical protein
VAENNQLTGDEVLMLVEALEAFAPLRKAGDPWPDEKWWPYLELRERLRDALGMHLFDDVKTWCGIQQRNEREAVLDEVHRRLTKLLEEPGLTRRTLRDGMRLALREIKERQWYERPPMGGWPMAYGRRDAADKDE